MKRAKKLTALIISAVIPATIVSSLTIYALIQNNNQGESFNTITGEFEYIYLFKVFSLSFIVIFLPVFSLLMFLWLIFFDNDRISGKKKSKK